MTYKNAKCVQVIHFTSQLLRAMLNIRVGVMLPSPPIFGRYPVPSEYAKLRSKCLSVNLK